MSTTIAAIYLLFALTPDPAPVQIAEFGSKATCIEAQKLFSRLSTRYTYILGEEVVTKYNIKYYCVEY